jgi:hypothetical protein
VESAFVVARNPDPESKLPYLVRLPIDGGLVLKSREDWPYGVLDDEGRLLATVEGKTLEDFAGSLSNATLAFRLQRLSEVPAATVVVEANYPDMFRQPGGRAAWLADMVARLQVRYREVAVVFAGLRRFGEEWTNIFRVALLANR